MKLGINLRTIPIQSNYSATVFDDTINANALSSALTVTLPDATLVPGKQIIVNKTDSSANTVTVSPVSGQSIVGYGGNVILYQYGFISCTSNGSVWVSQGSPSVGASLYYNNVQNFSSGTTFQQFIFPQVEYDTNGAYSPSTGNYTVPVSGKYLLTAAMGVGGATGRYAMAIFKNGGNYKRIYDTYINGASVGIQMSGSAVAQANAGDTLGLYMFQNTGSTQGTDGDQSNNHFEITRIGS